MLVPKEALKCRFVNGMLILPVFISKIVSKKEGITFAGEKFKRDSSIKKLLNLLSGILFFRIRKAKYVIFSSTLFNVKENGKYFNSLHDSYYKLFEDETLLVEDADLNYSWVTKKNYKNISFFNTYIVFISKAIAVLLNKFHKRTNPDYAVLNNIYPRCFTDNELSCTDYFVGIYAFFIRKILKYINPEIIYVNCACYGYDRAILTYVAKQLGVKVIEPQHGLIYNHPIYGNHCDELLSSEDYYCYLPDAIFTFGSFWNNQIDWKIDKVVVGLPYLNQKAAAYKSANSDTKYDLLIVTQPFNDNDEIQKVSFVKEICRLYPNLKILLRIHPAENYESVVKLYDDFDNLHVTNHETSLYDNFASCKHVLGWCSTCLYELLAFEKTPIIVDCQISRDYVPENIGVWIKNASDLLKVFEQLDSGYADVDYLWERHFESNVLNYLRLAN